MAAMHFDKYSGIFSSEPVTIVSQRIILKHFLNLSRLSIINIGASELLDRFCSVCHLILVETMQLM